MARTARDVPPGTPAPPLSWKRRGTPWILLAAVVLLTVFPLTSNDLWWHLATGRYMADTGTLPRFDPFAFAAEPLPWVNHAWLFDLGLFATNRVLGADGLHLLRMILVGMLALVLWRDRRRREEPWTSLAWVVFLLAAMRHRMMVRPELLALVLFAVMLRLWLGGHRHRLPLTAVVLVVWVNVHASFLLGLGALGPLVFREWLLRRSWNSVLRSLPLFLVPLLNPFGAAAYLAPLRLMGDLERLPVANPEWLAPSLPYFAPLLAALVVTATVFALGLGEQEWRHTLPAGLLLAALTVMAATSLRHAGFFAVGAALLVPPLRLRWSAPLLGLLAAAAFSWQVAWVQQPGWGVDRQRFPVTALTVTREVPPPGRLYNSAGLGGFLIWTLYPDHQVFMDGRNELFMNVLPQVNAARGNLGAWQELLDRYGMSWAVLEYEGETAVAQGGRSHAVPTSWARFPPWSWALMAWDDAAMVFYARPQGKTLPGEFRFNPESPGYLAERIRRGEWQRDDVREELARALARDPGCRRAQHLLGVVAELESAEAGGGPREWYQ